jgi:RNA polymerase sigma factor (sigma-70 family)
MGELSRIAVARPALGHELARHRPELLRQARCLAGNAAEAHDLVEEVLDRAAGGVPDGNVRAWLYMLLVRCCRDHCRRQSGRGEASAESVGWPQVTETEFASALGRLSPSLRQIFELHEVYHLRYDDIAARLDLPVNAVAVKLRQAREKLQRMLSRALARGGR